MTTDTEALRAQFEAWAIRTNYLIAKGRSGGYRAVTTHYAWEGYQAGHAAAIATQKTPAMNDNAGCAATVNDNAGRWPGERHAIPG